jgi:hypothetical protein
MKAAGVSDALRVDHGEQWRPGHERDPRIIALRAAGMKQEVIAHKFGISQQRVSTIVRLAAARRRRLMVDNRG